MTDFRAEFEHLTAHLEYREHAIFPSEIYRFASLAKKLDVDCIIESGVGFGGSTIYLCTLFPDIPIMSIDNDRFGKFNEVREEARQINKSAFLIKGDSRKILPGLLPQLYVTSIAVLIDGPKQKEAVALARFIGSFSNVDLIAIHDLHPSLVPKGAFDSRQHYDAVKDLDDKVSDKYRKAYPRGPGLTVYDRRQQ